MEDNGMYTNFRVYDQYLKTEFYLLYDWVSAKYGKVSKWVQTLTTTGVGNGNVKFLPICNLDCDNLAWSGKAVIAAIVLDICENIIKYLFYDASGPEVFCVIIQKNQHVNYFDVRAIFQALQKMRLTD